MRYFVDCEFNGFGGELLSIAIVSEEGDSLYLAIPKSQITKMRTDGSLDHWVADHVLPVMSANGLSPKHMDRAKWGFELQRLLRGDSEITFVADWPEDISHLMQIMMVGRGGMINLPVFNVEMRRVDAYYVNLAGAVRHNALWDAMSLKNLYEVEMGNPEHLTAKRA